MCGGQQPRTRHLRSLSSGRASTLADAELLEPLPLSSRAVLGVAARTGPSLGVVLHEFGEECSCNWWGWWYGCGHRGSNEDLPGEGRRDRRRAQARPGEEGGGP